MKRRSVAVLSENVVPIRCCRLFQVHWLPLCSSCLPPLQSRWLQ
jgi:hypothetical protein